MVRRLSMPALAAGLCAMFIIFGNAHAPRKVNAQMADIQSATSSLRIQQDAIQGQIDEARDHQAALVARLTSNIHLMQSLPPNVDAMRISRALFECVPPNVTVTRVSINARATPCFVDITATCDAVNPAGVVAADWARQLSESSLFAEAEVSSVSGGDKGQAALFAIRVTVD